MNEQDKIYQKQGRLASLKEKRQEIRIAIDVIAKGISVLFDPMDNDCVYVDTVDKLKLKIYTQDFLKKRAVLDEYNKQIEDIEKELRSLGEALGS